MPIYQKLCNFDQMFHQLSEPPIIINDIISATEREREYVKDLITTRYQTDTISILPSCQCGKTKGEFMLRSHHGRSAAICDYCNTPVTSIIDRDIEPLLWLRKPKGIEKIINPVIWMMLENNFKIGGYVIPRWIADTAYRPLVKVPQIIDNLASTGIQRGYNQFVRNFDQLLDLLCNIKKFKVKKPVQYLRQLVEDNRDCIFSDYLPLPNRALLIIERTDVGVYVDKPIIEAIDAIEMMTSLDTPFSPVVRQRDRENRVIKALAMLGNFYQVYYATNLNPKEGQFRRHAFGSRTHHTFRCVISSNTYAHEYDELYIPWGVGVTALRHHLLNHLRRGTKGQLRQNYNETIGMLYAHVNRYHPLLDEIFQTMIRNSAKINRKGKVGLPSIVQRNEV